MTTNEHNAFPAGRWTSKPAVKLVTLAGKTYEPLNNVAGKEYACPFCQSLLHRLMGKPIGTVTIECLNVNCDAKATGKDIESAYDVLRYAFETRDVPAITGQDTCNEYER